MKYPNNNGDKIMKRTGTILLLLVLSAGLIFGAPRVKIITQYVTPEMLKSAVYIPDSTVANGLNNVAKGTFVYLQAWNFGDTGSISSATWTFNSKPTGSNAALTPITGLSWWAKFKADLTGKYEIKVSVVTSTGSKDTTTTIYAATYVGTGGFDGVPAVFPNCMSCHNGQQQFTDIFNKWKVSGHATRFKTQITSGSSSYSTSCMKCHTVGYDHTIVSDNGGFDDKARQLGWVWSNYSPPKPGNWDTIKIRFPSLVAFASIGCESCHGPGSEHVYNGGDTNRIQRSVDEGVCGKCHDALNNHYIFTQWKKAKHSNVVYSNSFVQQNNGTNDLGNCIRCHDGKGYVNFTKGIGTNTNSYNIAQQEMIACASCHDPHGSTNEFQLRTRPVNSDTLANGFHYTVVGNGIVCLDCHKSRRNAMTYTTTRITSAHWGPHYSGQADQYQGQNYATFTGFPPYRNTLHKEFLADACATCHMAPTDTSSTSGNKNKVGGHTLKLHNDSTNYDHMEGCKGCHAGKTNFDQFMADQDYDGDTQIESWRHEVEGCLTLLRIQLPPVGVDSVSWQMIGADTLNPDHLKIKKAYYNYLLVEEEGSEGMHNPKFAIDVLVYSRQAIIGIIPISNEVPMRFELTQNYPNPFNPTTYINFAIPKQSDVTIKIYDITGREVKTLVNQKMIPGTYKVDWQSDNNAGKIVSSGVYFYRIIAGGFTDTKKMVLVR
ncbi:MAG TPA: ammonia-forming cytochrome c nitrite reductase subunit c552 [Ignavibacteria bacterium]|nr:ammonia-forming cytochrome c nitrite reductase subunit c552 [Ignavibacteria bacterium]